MNRRIARRSRTGALALAVLVTTASISMSAPIAHAADAGAPLPSATSSVRGKRPGCVDAQSLTALTYTGNDHVVTLQNRCKKRVTCEVWTDVAPEKLSATLAPGETTELVTFRGSPAREFHATADCREN